MPKLLRNERKRRVHRVGCRAADGPYVKRWVWADDKPMEAIREVLATTLIGYVPCKICRPLEVQA